MNRRCRHCAAGFTMVDMAAVVGAVVIMVAAAAVLLCGCRSGGGGKAGEGGASGREGVYRARSQARLAELSNGCVRYSQDNKGLYPGQLDYAQLRGSRPQGNFTGTQLLAACLFGFPYSAISGGNMDGKDIYAPYASGDLITVNGRNNSIWDRYSRSEKMTVLYYPSRLGQPGMAQYVQGDNSDYTSGTSWQGGSFYEYITDPRATSGSTPYKPGQFLLISAGVDGVYGTQDDLKNFGN